VRRVEMWWVAKTRQRDIGMDHRLVAVRVAPLACSTCVALIDAFPAMVIAAAHRSHQLGVYACQIAAAVTLVA